MFVAIGCMLLGAVFLFRGSVAMASMSEIVAYGIPFNPFSSNDMQGRAYSVQTGEKLSTEMTKNGWTDPLFVTANQAVWQGFSLVAGGRKAGSFCGVGAG